MIKLAVGYQLADPGEERFPEIAADYREEIAEVYFPWGDMPTARAAIMSRQGFIDWTGQQRMEEDIAELRRLGFNLDVLFNAGCYGRYAVSRYLENTVVSVLERIGEVAGGADLVTTASPVIAQMIRKRFPDIRIRASVNMRIGTPAGVSYVTDLFDSVCVEKEINRDMESIRFLKAWCDARGKEMIFLANSGCLAFCPGQTFHDTMIAHDREIDQVKNVPGLSPHVCWNYLADPSRWVSFLRGTWVRPEDLDRYEPFFGIAKLATRMHRLPRLVIDSYARRSYAGNLPDLFEPGHGPVFAQYIIDNTRFPADWHDRVTTCGRRCASCSYCDGVLEHVLVRTE